jgi:DNA-binding response OmpR family regulator
MDRVKTTTKNIMVVTPDKDFFNSVRLYLEDSYNIYDRRTLDKIEYTIMLRRIDILLIDVDTMPSGFVAAVWELRKKYPKLVIIVLYTYFAEQQDEKQLAVVSNEMLAKPFDVKLLKKHLDSYL